MISTKRQILFIDDDANLLNGLQRMLRPLRHEWEMEFAVGGKLAVELLNKRCFDVVITDMRMPELNGAAVLKEAKNICPSTVRLVLSGQAEELSVFQAIGDSHQYLAKPCSASDLRERLTRACLGRDLIKESNFKNKLTELSSLPCQVNLVKKLTTLLDAVQPNLEQISMLISIDLGLSSKILQLANSAYFFSGIKSANIFQATKLIGVELLRKICTTEILNLSQDQELSQLNSNAALLASQASIHNQDYTQIFLSHIGELALRQLYQEEYKEVEKLILKNAIKKQEAENQIFKLNSPTVTNYLLALWGIPIELPTYEQLN